jgi:signal transduction histidine kinase
MNWLALFCVAVASACLTLAATHAVVWFKDRTARANLAFSMLALGVAGFAWCNLLTVVAQTQDEFVRALWWMNVTLFLMVAPMVAFVRFYFRTARPWLGHLAWGLRLIALAVNFVREPVFNYDSVSAVRTVDFLGVPVTVLDGRGSLWVAFGQFGLAVLLVFVLDASIRAWRAGSPEEKRRALAVGFPTAFFVAVGSAWAALIFAGVLDWPHLESIFFLGVLCAMAHELSADVLRAARLTGELQRSHAALRDSEQRISMAAEAARLGIWIRDLATDAVWLTSQCRELFAFPAHATVTYRMFLDRLEAEDRRRVEREDRLAVRDGALHQSEGRLPQPDGSVRWVVMHRRVDLDPSGRPFRMLGIAVDVTEQRRAEFAARELSGRLINAQEDERRRIARDLHDDFSQRLSLLSVELALLSRLDAPIVDGSAYAENRGSFDDLIAQVRELSTEVHRLSHQLHPAKLDQLGLETAARSWCRDIARQSGLRVAFEARDIPRDLPPDTALCAYRILQEALQNVVRHSRAQVAHVVLSAAAGSLSLSVRDDGEGFDTTRTSRSGLGLLSMRERAHLLHGSLEIDSAPGGGSCVALELPLPDGVAIGLTTTWRGDRVGSG